MLTYKRHSLNNLSFIDLFAGIGGFHYALSSFGAKCVYASEWDESAKQTYFNNFNLVPDGDITKVNEKDIPTHDILCGGFPCQAFSISGKQKGFEDTRGTLFFDIARITEYHRPKVLFLENVKNLLQHDKGKTFKVICNTLQNLGYDVFFQILNTGDFGLPQHRERLYIVAFRKDLKNKKSFCFPTPKIASCLEKVLENHPNNAKIIERDDIVINKNFQYNQTLFTDFKNYPNKPIQIGFVNKGGQGERIYHPIGHAITLSAYGGGVGAKTGLYLIDGKVRKLTPRECARLQGFPDDFKINENQNQAYKQFGNSVSINVLQYIVQEIEKVLLS